MNAPFVLHTHLNHPANEAIVPLLCEHAAALGAAATRLLRLLCQRLFRASLYRHRDPAVRYRGAFGTVYKGRLPLAPHDVAIKLLDVPSSIHDRCVLPDLFAEVRPSLGDTRKRACRATRWHYAGVACRNFRSITVRYHCARYHCACTTERY
jgi:hypothetical protein